jgi:hypothetical protein
MPIRIPADLTIVTLRLGGRELAQRWTTANARAVFQAASELLRARADVEFFLEQSQLVVEEMPAGVATDTVDEAGYHFLVAAHAAGRGVRVLLVDQVARRELGGQAREATRTCLIPYGSNASETGRRLAHEFGHLLDLPHVEGTRGPGQEAQAAAWARNLMNSGLIGPAAELNPAQVRRARGSRLARGFGGR